MIPRREARSAAFDRRARVYELPVEVRSPLHERVRALFGRRRRERLVRQQEERAAAALGDRIVQAAEGDHGRLRAERAALQSEREQIRQELLADMEAEGGGGAASA